MRFHQGLAAQAVFQRIDNAPALHLNARFVQIGFFPHRTGQHRQRFEEMIGTEIVQPGVRFGPGHQSIGFELRQILHMNHPPQP